jgi:hypothetical protein
LRRTTAMAGHLRAGDVGRGTRAAHPVFLMPAVTIYTRRSAWAPYQDHPPSSPPKGTSSTRSC